MRVTLTVGILAVLTLTGCADANTQESAPRASVSAVPAQSVASSSGSPSTLAVAHGDGRISTTGTPAVSTGQGGTQTAGGLSWTSPKRWTIGPERAMRAATYTVPAATGDAEDGECAVFFFGPGQGGGVEANIDRWIGQFEQPDGKPSAERAKRKSESIDGIPVATIDLTGTYKGGGPAMGTSTPKPGYRLLGAIATGPQAGIFFKLTGPAKTVAAAEKEFQTMIASLRQ